MIQETEKNEFEAGELDEIYNLISRNIKSSYSSKILEEAKKVMKEFVDK